MIESRQDESERGVDVPKLSVVMPAYNAEKYIERAIESILSQTFTNLELVIVDDASTDRTLELAEAAAVQDPRVRVFRTAKNLGVSAATNLGIAEAHAELIGRMDADDVSDPARFEKQLALLQANPHFAVIGSYASHTNDNEDILSLSRTGPPSETAFNSLREAGKPTMVFGGTALFTKDLFERAGRYDAGLVRAVDIDLFDRMSDYGPVIAVPEPLLLYRMHADGIVSRTFFEGRQIHRFVKARRLAQHHGRHPMDLEKYRVWEQQLPVWRRIVIRLDDLAQFHYREAGIAYGRGDRVGFLSHITFASIIKPWFVARRIWSQRFSSSARSLTNGD